MSLRGVILGLGAGAVLLLYMRQAQAAAEEGAYEGEDGYSGEGEYQEGQPGNSMGGIFDGITSIFDSFQLVDFDMSNTNLQAFLMLIRSGESSTGPGAYQMIVGGGSFSDFSDHPRIYKKIGIGTTSAAGAYQITARTWDDINRVLKLPNFSPENQDKAAVALVKRRGALADVLAGRFETAIRKCRNEWTSLPGASEALYTLQEAKRRLVAYGGTITEGTVYA